MQASQVDVTEELVQRQLFGGAFDMSMPARFADISSFRPVPDSQEVFADASVDQSFIVEVLERISAEDCSSAEVYFRDLAEQNGATACTIYSVTPLSAEAVPCLPSSAYAALAVGMQVVSKGRQRPDSANTVQVAVALLRLPEVESDVAVQLNTPRFISLTAAENNEAGSLQMAALSQLLLQVLSTLDIKDWGLFGKPGPSNAVNEEPSGIYI